jgi:hypothetical protein
MPKNRKRANEKGAKSVSIRTKHKIGGRKSSLGTNTMTRDEIIDALKRGRKRDHNKLFHALGSSIRVH